MEGSYTYRSGERIRITCSRENNNLNNRLPDAWRSDTLFHISYLENSLDPCTHSSLFSTTDFACRSGSCRLGPSSTQKKNCWRSSFSVCSLADTGLATIDRSSHGYVLRGKDNSKSGSPDWRFESARFQKCLVMWRIAPHVPKTPAALEWRSSHECARRLGIGRSYMITCQPKLSLLLAHLHLRDGREMLRVVAPGGWQSIVW